MINHSCSPNCLLAFKGTTILLKTIYPIHSGEELNFTYIDSNDPSPVRQNRLLEDYFFKCSCSKCQSKV